MSSGVYKAVCYRCAYEGHGTRCPVCQFPMIMEREGTPPGGQRVEDIFARESLSTGAPPLPGVHAEKRKAQLLAEARRERIASQRIAASAVQERAAEPAPVPDSVRIPRFRHSALKLALLCAFAIAAGVMAAALQSGAL